MKSLLRLSSPQLIAKLIKVGKGIKERQMIFMVLESFRTYDRLDLVFGVEHLYKLTYPGDKKMGDFKQRWLETVAGIKPKSIPQEEQLRDTLYQKLLQPTPPTVNLSWRKSHRFHIEEATPLPDV